jgi:hypothetical protein
VKAVLSLPDDELARQHGAWTNLMKIGADPEAGGNPVGLLADLQRGACEALLELEMRVLDPTGIVFLTNDYEWNLVEKIVFCGGEPAWDRHDLFPEALWTATRRRARVYTTYHPRSRQMQSGLGEKVIAAIADDQKGWLK